MKLNIRLLYLYLFSGIGLLILTIGCVRLVELGIKVYVFKNADQYVYSNPPYPTDVKDVRTKEEKEQEEAKWKAEQEVEQGRQRQREASGAIAMILIGAPLYFYHWKTITKENKSA